MSHSTLTLYGDSFWISPYFFSCFVSLLEKSIPFEVQSVALHQHEQRNENYTKSTVTARVPALRHGDFVLAESSAILEYLEDAFVSPKHSRVLPVDMYERARARQMMSWLRSEDTLALRKERPTTSMFYEPSKEPLTEAGVRCAAKLVEVTDRILVPEKANLFSSWSIADSELAFMLHRLILNGYDLPTKIRAYAETQWARSSVQAFVNYKRPAFVPYS